MTKLYIHHGYNKTGTTAIQEFCRSNRDQLIRNGVLYPSYGTQDIAAHHRIAAHFCRIPPKHFVEKRSLQNVIGEVLRELDKSGVDTMLISTEMMVFYKDFYGDKLQELLGCFDETYLISYVRRQDEYANSYYNSAVRNGRCADDFSTFISGINLDYFDNLTQWEELFGAGNIIVRPYRKERFTKQSIQADFLSIFGIRADEDWEELPFRPNEALSLELVYVLRECARHNIRQYGKFVARVREFMATQEDLPPAPEYFSRQERIVMIDEYRSSNLQVSKRWCDGAPLFDDAVSEGIGATGSYDEVVKYVFAELYINDWNATHSAPRQDPKSKGNGRRSNLFRKALRKNNDRN